MRNALGILAISIAMCAPAFANKPLVSVEKTAVGSAEVVDIQPTLSATRQGNKYERWNERIVRSDASFLKAHFVDVNLRDGDRIVLVNGRGRVIEEITGRGPKDRGTFWALSSQGDTLVVRFEYRGTYSQLPFRIDRLIAGDKELFAPRVDSGARSICSPGDFEDAICYQGDTGKWDNVRASVGVMSVGGNAATALFCSGSNISGSNAVLTNQHCVETQSVCDNTEFVFEAYNTQCGVASPLSTWQSFRCDTVLAQEPFINCDAGPGDLDFTLATVIGDPAATYGFAQADPTPLASNEEIYIVQHPAGRPHEITIGSGADVVVDGSVLRYYNTLDTEGGSSGSPIFRGSDNKLVGLHHCGGCSTPGTGNRGMLMSEIYPLITNFLCVEGDDLRSGGADNLVEVTGNGDTVVDPGETWSFTISAFNNSCSLAATGISAEISVASGDAILSTTTVTFADLAAGVSGVSDPIEFTVPTDNVCGSASVFDVDSITSGGAGSFPGQAGVLSVSTGAQLQTNAFTEDFSGGLTNWTIEDGGTGTGLAVTWTTGNPGGRSLSLTAPYAIVDSDELGTGQNMDEGLISAPVDTTGFDNVMLQFTHDFNYYSAGLDEQADVEVRSAATLGVWTAVANYSGGDTSGTVQLDITAYSGPDLQIRFHYYNASYEWWWAIDDVTIFGLDPFGCNVFGGSDTDGDGIDDDADNCTLVGNADQRDTNGDGYGNICDADLDNNGVINAVDLGLLKAVFFSADPDADLNGDGAVNSVDLGIMKTQFFGAPGPSGVAP